MAKKFHSNQVAGFERHLARKLHFNMLKLQFPKDVLNESVVSQLQLGVFQGRLAEKLPFHNLFFQLLKEVSQETRFWR